MSQLVAQDIHRLCNPPEGDGWPAPMITPYSADRVVIRGRSAGLSSASYDVRIASDLTLSAQPQYALAKLLARRDTPRRTLLKMVPPNSPDGHPTPEPDMGRIVMELARALDLLDSLADLSRRSLEVMPYALANTLEDFAMPTNVVGYVVDKSSHARLFVSAFNTLLDPGWAGNLTLELINLSAEDLVLKAGDPICQIAFHYTTQSTDRPYSGKYMNQPKKPVPAIFETA